MTEALSDRKRWLWLTAASAYSGGHIYPRMAACEAALESNWGQSELARVGNNLFGLKQKTHPVYGTLVLPTKEFLDGRWQEVDAGFVSYESMQDCFTDRMETLRRLEGEYAHYAAALTAADADTYVREVSKTWSTDPQRADKVIEIYNQNFQPPVQPLES